MPDIREPSSDEQAALKRAIYDKLHPRRRKFIDRIGYDSWDPFQKPNDPLDLRTDATNRTASQLLASFQRETSCVHGAEYGKGALECALGIVKREEKYKGVMDFCLWYHRILQKEGHV